MKKTARNLLARILILVYMAIMASPLASLAMHSKIDAQAVTGVCSGDCRICGCSEESMASKTCCCSKKKLLQAREHKDEQCTLPAYEDKKTPPKKQTVISRCGCPCNGKTLPAVSAGTINEFLPIYFSEQFTPLHADTKYFNHPLLLNSRQINPPDSPPD